MGSGSLGVWIGKKSDSCEGDMEPKLIFGRELSDAKFLVQIKLQTPDSIDFQFKIVFFEYFLPQMDNPPLRF